MIIYLYRDRFKPYMEMIIPSLFNLIENIINKKDEK